MMPQPTNEDSLCQMTFSKISNIINAILRKMHTYNRYNIISSFQDHSPFLSQNLITMKRGSGQVTRPVVYCMNPTVHSQCSMLLLPAHMQTPGPGTYKTVDPQMYGNKSAAYTLHIRGPLPSDNFKTPGPGAHSPEKV